MYVLNIMKISEASGDDQISIGNTEQKQYHTGFHLIQNFQCEDFP